MGIHQILYIEYKDNIFSLRTTWQRSFITDNVLNKACLPRSNIISLMIVNISGLIIVYLLANKLIHIN